MSPPKDEYKLLQSHIILRHGDRTQGRKKFCWENPPSIWLCGDERLYGMTITYPANGSNPLFGNCMVHEDLTIKGFMQLNKHGADIRERYMNYYSLIPKELNWDNEQMALYQFRFRATEKIRCQESVVAFFLGLYPNYHRYKQEIALPLLVEDDAHAILGHGYDEIGALCPPLLKIIKARENSKAWQNFQKNEYRLADIEAKSILGLSCKDVFDCANVHCCHNLDVPSELSQELYEKASAIRLQSELYRIKYPNYVNATKYREGPLLKWIYLQFRRMIENARNGIDEKLYVYGGHHSGQIMPLLFAFGYNLTKWVPLSSVITLELFEKSDEYFVLISYNGTPLQIPQCCIGREADYKLCEWKLFEKWMREITPTQNECPNMKL